MAASAEESRGEEQKNVPEQADADTPCARLPMGDDRPQALLENLRRQGLFCDAVIAVGEKEFPVHRAIVAHLSPFFFKSFTGDFSEAESRKLSIEGASPDAVSAVLDYGYGIDVSDSLEDDCNLAAEVWQLAHRFEISELVEISGRIAVAGATVENCVRLFLQASMFECEEEVDKMFQFIVRRFKEVHQDCDDFKYVISAEDLEEFLGSEDLVAKEVDKYDCIKTWSQAASEESRQDYLHSLLANVHFELMSKLDLKRVLLDVEFLPKTVLCRALESNLNGGVRISGVHLADIFTVGVEKRPFTRSASDFALPLGARTGEFFLALLPPFRFMCNRWVMVAWTEVRLGHIFLVMRFDYRHSAALDNSNLAKDVSRFTFDVASKVVTEKNEPFDTILHTRLSPKSNVLSVKVLKRANATVSDGTKDDRGDLTLLVNMRCRRSPKTSSL